MLPDIAASDVSYLNEFSVHAQLSRGGKRARRPPRGAHGPAWLGVPTAPSLKMLLTLVEASCSRMRRDSGRVWVHENAMLVFGFVGASSDAAGARWLAASITAGNAGGALFMGHNFGADIAGLTSLFQSSGRRVILAADQEGGDVQRLSRSLGFTDIPRARAVAARLSLDEATVLYETAGREFRSAGFNLNLGPVVDLDDPGSPIIGAFGRAFRADPEIVASYAEAFIGGFGDSGVATALKHFPGQGRCQRDTHAGGADGTATWTADELLPFERLIAASRAPAIMISHMAHTMYGGVPATFSPVAIGSMLRDQFRYRGVVVTDDLSMGAVRELLGPEEAIVEAIAAGNDLILLSAIDDPSLPERAVEAVVAAIAAGRITQRQIRRSNQRLSRLLR